MADEELKELERAVLRMQQFDPESLNRKDPTAPEFNWGEAITTARHLVNLYKQIALANLRGLSGEDRDAMKGRADIDYEKLRLIQSFNPHSSEATTLHRNYTKELNEAYAETRKVLLPIIEFITGKSPDSLDMEEKLNERIEELEEELKRSKRISAKKGTKDAAIYFENETAYHRAEAKKFEKIVTRLTIFLAFLAFASIFVHKIPFLTPTNTPESIQLIASKIILFSVFGYFLVLSAKNFLSHRHNAVVNQHRQNALKTFETLTNAAEKIENKDIILIHASICIFSPQETGYVKTAPSNAPATTIPATGLISRGGSSDSSS